MEIFFYQSPLEVPFAAPYSREFFTDKQVLLISNKSEILGEFETHRAAIMEDGITKIIGTKVFVPVAVKTVFLTWLKAAYSTIYWQEKAEFADFKPEVTDELQAFFQQVRIVEKWEGGTMQRDESTSTTKVEPDENKFAEATADASKYVSMGFAIIVVLSLLISLISLKSSGDVRQSQVDYVLNTASNGQTEEAKKLYWCGMLARFFKSELEKTSPKTLTLYNRTCPSSQTKLPSTQPVQTSSVSADDKKKMVGENYKLAKAALSKQYYVTFSNTEIEMSSALWYAKEIWNIESSQETIQKVDEILKEIIKGYLNLTSLDPTVKCGNIRKVHNFSCQHTQLTVVTKEVENKFTECKLTCPSPSTTGK